MGRVGPVGPVDGRDATELLVEFLELFVDDVEAEVEAVVRHEEHVAEEGVLVFQPQRSLVLVREFFRGRNQRRVR